MFNKKSRIRGDPTSFILIVAFVLIVSVAAYFIMGYTSFLSGEVASDLNSSKAPTLGDNNSIQAAQTVQSDSLGTGDNIVFWFFIAAIIGFWVSAWYTGFSPITIGIYIIVILIGVYLGGLAADVRDDFKTDLADMGSGSFVLSNAVLGRYYPAILVFVGAVGIIIMFAKRGSPTPQ